MAFHLSKLALLQSEETPSSAYIKCDYLITYHEPNTEDRSWRQTVYHTKNLNNFDTGHILKQEVLQKLFKSVHSPFFFKATSDHFYLVNNLNPKSKMLDIITRITKSADSSY